MRKFPISNFQFPILLIVMAILLVVLFLPLVSQAGLVPCGPGVGTSNDPGYDPKLGYIPCQLCHLFVLLENVVNFIFKFIILPVATLLLIIGGVMFFFYAEDPKMVDKAKTLLTSVVIGLVLIFAAFLIVGAFLNAIGLAEWTKNIYQDWLQGKFFKIKCPLSPPSS